MARKFSSKGKRLAVQIPLLLFFIVLDLVIKRVVQEKLAPIGTVTVLDGVFDLTYVQNTGMAWGLLGQRSMLLSIIVGCILLVMILYLFFTKESNIFWHICFACIIGGGAGNLIDRLLHGFVTDYLRFVFIDFPVFNLADCLIVVGCFSLIGYLLADVIREWQSKRCSEKSDE